MPPVGLEPTISAGERPQTYALDRAATGTGIFSYNTNPNSEAWKPYLVSGLMAITIEQLAL